MSKPYLLIITGFPGTGKSSLAINLAASLLTPAISKDAIKERVFDTLGTQGQAWSRQVSATAHRVMDYMIDAELSVGHSLILESNFKPEYDSQRFNSFQAKYDCQLIQILCWAEGEVLFERFTKRQRSTERHAGHVIEINDEQLRKDFAPGKCEPLRLEAPLLEFDTTDLGSIDYKDTISQIQSLIDQ